MAIFFEMNLAKRIFLTIVCSLALLPLYAQEDEGELEDVEIEIVKERQITLPKADRNFEKIPPRPVEQIKSPIQYNFQPFSFQAGPISPTIRPLKLKQENSSKVYGGYLSAGYGNYASPYLEGFINSKKDKNKLVGAHGLFSSSDKGPVDGQNSGSGLTLLSVYGKSFKENISLSGDAGFENRSTHFYGYPDGLDVDGKSIKQSYSLFKVRGDVTNTRATDFSYNLGAGFSTLADKYDARETEVDVDLYTRYKFSESSALGLKAGYVLLNRKDDLVPSNQRHLFFANPRLEFSVDEKLKLNAGATISYENDTIGNKDLHVYPDVRASYPLTPSVELLASLTGGIEKVSLQTLSNENIWIDSNIPISHTNKLYDLQAALHTKIGNRIAVNGGFSLAALKNWYFFMNSESDQSRFVPLYDTKATVRGNFFASIGFVNANNVNLLFRGDYFDYSRKDDAVAWHRPTYKVTADASFNIVKKILFDVKLIAQGGMEALDPVTDTKVTLDPALDLNARAEYMFSDSFSFFVQFNNLISSDYQLYLYYPVRGFQVQGGLSWTF
jgi:hypothetical protein